MEYSYLCDVCGNIYVSSANYSNLKPNTCCDVPIWYTRKQVAYMKLKTPDELKQDYGKYLSDLEKKLKDD